MENINKIYQAKNGETEALRNVNFSVNEGEFVSIIGPSGCGKSTILSIVAGLENKTSGFSKLIKAANVSVSLSCPSTATANKEILKKKKVFHQHLITANGIGIVFQLYERTSLFIQGIVDILRFRIVCNQFIQQLNFSGIVFL